MPNDPALPLPLPPAAAVPPRAAPRLLGWLWAGVQREATATGQRKVMQVNAGAALTILTVLVFNAVYMSSGNGALMRSGWSQLPFALVAPWVWVLNGQGKLFAARWLLFVNAMLATFAVIVGGQGTEAGAQVYYLLYGVMPAMFYDIKEWRSSALLLALNLGIYIALEAWGWPAHPELAAMGASALQGMRLSMLIGCLVVVVGVVALSEHTAEANERRLLQLARTDPLTGLANRRAFRETLHAEAHRAQRTGSALAMAIVDLDHFKAVNDSIGHDGGDAVLCHVAKVMGESVRAYDLVARLGGEEFALLMPGASLAQALQGAERLRATLAGRPFAHGGKALQITLSAGVVQWQPGMNEDQALQAADQALYRAKHEGRNRVVAVA